MQGLTAFQEVWQIIRRRIGRILLLTVLGLAGGAAYGWLTGPWYDSTAQLLVIKKRLETSPISGPDQARAQEEYLSTHIQLITSRRVIEQAVKRGELQRLELFREKDDVKKSVSDWVSHTLLGATSDGPSENRVVKEIIRALVVSRDAAKPGVSPSNEILNISFRGRTAADCPKVLEAVIGSYESFLEETYRNTNKEMLELIEHARKMVQKDLDAKEAAYQKFLAERPPLWKGPDKSTAQQDRLLKIDARLAALRMRRAEIEAAVATIEKVVKSGRNPTVLVGLMAGPAAAADVGAPTLPAQKEPWFAERKPGVSLEEELLRLHVQEAKILAVRAENHPEALAVRRQIANIRAMIQPTTGNVQEAAAQTERRQDVGSIKVELLKQELDGLKAAEQSLSRLFEAEQQGVSSSYLHEVQDDSFRKAIERDRLLYESILQRVKEINTVRDFGGYNTQVIGPPLRGELAVRKCLLLAGLSLFGGLLAGFGLAYLAEVSAKKAPAPFRPLLAKAQA